MEEYDDLAAGPTDDGSMSLCHDTWKTLPDLAEFSNRLLHLDMSNNQLDSIPESIGNLILLQTLNVSFNQIEDIDGAIGKCIRLRRLNLARNRVQSLPTSIGSCILLVSDSLDTECCASFVSERIVIIVISPTTGRIHCERQPDNYASTRDDGYNRFISGRRQE